MYLLFHALIPPGCWCDMQWWARCMRTSSCLETFYFACQTSPKRWALWLVYPINAYQTKWVCMVRVDCMYNESLYIPHPYLWLTHMRMHTLVHAVNISVSLTSQHRNVYMYIFWCRYTIKKKSGLVCSAGPSSSAVAQLTYLLALMPCS